MANMTSKINSFNLAANEVTPSQVTMLLRKVFAKGGHPMPICLCGKPGIGKSQSIQQVCREFGVSFENGNYHEIRASMVVDSSDLTGLPVVSKKTRVNNGGTEEYEPVTQYSRPEQLPIDTPSLSDEERNKLHVIFFDEINRSSDPSIMNAIFQVTTEFKIGPHKLLPNVIILLAMNPEAEGYLVNSMDPALINRLCFLFMNTSFSDWKEYAQRKGINQGIVDFLEAHRELLSHDGIIKTEGADKRFPTPRAWENVNRQIDLFDFDFQSDNKEDNDLAYKVIAGVIGEQTALDFCTFMRTSANARPFTGAEIVDGYLSNTRIQTVIKATDSKGVRKYDTTKVQQTLAGVTDIVKKEKDKLSDKQLANMLAFLVDIPVEQSMGFQNALTVDISADFTNWFFSTISSNKSLSALWKCLQENTKKYASNRKASSI